MDVPAAGAATRALARPGRARQRAIRSPDREASDISPQVSTNSAPTISPASRRYPHSQAASSTRCRIDCSNRWPVGRFESPSGLAAGSRESDRRAVGRRSNAYTRTALSRHHHQHRREIRLAIFWVAALSAGSIQRRRSSGAGPHAGTPRCRQAIARRQARLRHGPAPSRPRRSDK